MTKCKVCKKQVCDICGANISDAAIKYKFKKYESTYSNCDDWEFNKWSKLDMCAKCYYHFEDFVKQRKEEVES